MFSQGKKTYVGILGLKRCLLEGVVLYSKYVHPRCSYAENAEHATIYNQEFITNDLYSMKFQQLWNFLTAKCSCFVIYCLLRYVAMYVWKRVQIGWWHGAGRGLVCKHCQGWHSVHACNLVHKLRNMTINWVAFKIHLPFGPVTLQLALSGIFIEMVTCHHVQYHDMPNLTKHWYCNYSLLCIWL